MRIVYLLAFFSASAFAQDPAAVAAARAACGPEGVSFEVQADSSAHPMAQPGAGKALVYIIQDEGERVGGATIRTAADGVWVGANHHNSYFSFEVSPGEHHLCANWQSRLSRISRLTSLAHFQAEAGKIYFFRTRPIFGQSEFLLDLDPIDSDLGKLLVALYHRSVWRLK